MKVVLNTIFLTFFIPSLSYAFDHTFQSWGRVLDQYVVEAGSESGVKYSELKKNPQDLIQFISEIKNLSQEEYNLFSQNQKLAFLINSFNALCLKLVTDNYPVKSIKQIGSFRTSAWKKNFFTLFGQPRNLHWLEFEAVRKGFHDPRINFALAYPTKGSPVLKKDPYLPDRLPQQLEEAGKDFLRDPSKNRYDQRTKTLELSKIFDWRRKEFEKQYGSLEAHVAPRMSLSAEHSNLIRQGIAATRFIPYDWSLNLK